jgi:hypothetical protein
MANVGRPKAVLDLSDEERETLARWARRRKSSQALAIRSRIVLGSAEGLTNVAVVALLRRSDHRSVQALEADIRNWVKAWNESPEPFIWTKAAEQILESIGRLLKRISDAGH